MSYDLRAIADSDGRFAVEAYLFVFEALARSRAVFRRESHVTGPELLEGARLLALERYGRMARLVLNSWGLRETDDIGEIVFTLIRWEVMSRTESDRIEDFHAVYDFEDAFVRSYRIRPGESG